VHLSALTTKQVQSVLTGHGLRVPAVHGWPDSYTLIAFALAQEAGRDAGWLVIDDDLVIGQCALTGDPVGGSVEISYGLAASVRGNGRGRELVRLFSAELLARSDITEIVARVEIGNIPSQRALLAAGFEIASTAGEEVTFTRRS
jgi:RimJ/RimL family protein N-acetyltransferase